MRRKVKRAKLDASGTETLKLDMLCPDPNCNGKMEEINRWELKGRGEGGTLVMLLACNKCGLTLRKHRKLAKKETPKQ